MYLLIVGNVPMFVCLWEWKVRSTQRYLQLLAWLNPPCRPSSYFSYSPRVIAPLVRSSYLVDVEASVDSTLVAPPLHPNFQKLKVYLNAIYTYKIMLLELCVYYKRKFHLLRGFESLPCAFAE